MLEEQDFKKKCDAALEELRRRALRAADEKGFDVEAVSGKLEIVFEEPEEAKFVISPNTPVREIWVSALSTSFKLGWNASRNAFVLEKTGEDLHAVMSRVISQQLGKQVNAALANADLRKRILELGGEPMTMSPAELADYIAGETKKWAKVIKFAKIKAG